MRELTGERPRLLDLFCGAGGAAKGYQRAGFYVVGVDNRPQPNYCGDEFYQDDALELARAVITSSDLWYASEFDAIHASPPCQAYSRTRSIMGREHPDLVGPTRDLLDKTGLPYVIENVGGSPLRNATVLDGVMFGLGVVRPRYFETNWPLEVDFLRHPPGKPHTKMGRPPVEGEYLHVVGHFVGVEAGGKAMGIDWMSGREMAQAIPPAYTEFIGAQLMQHVRVEWRAGAVVQDAPACPSDGGNVCPPGFPACKCRDEGLLADAPEEQTP